MPAVGQAVQPEARHGLPPGRDRDSEGARSRGHSAIGVTIPGARSPGERVRLRKEK